MHATMCIQPGLDVDSLFGSLLTVVKSSGERLCWGVISSECSFLSSHHELCLQHVDLLFSEGIHWGGVVTYRIVLSSKRRALVPSLASRDAGSLDSQDVDSSGILCGILRDP